MPAVEYLIIVGTQVAAHKVYPLIDMAESKGPPSDDKSGSSVIILKRWEFIIDILK